jgi:hypothetical protein
MTQIKSAEPDEVRRMLREVAGMLLDEHVDELADRAVQRLRLDEPEYAVSKVSWDDLTKMMRRTLALALTRLSGRPMPDSIATAAADAGRLRAQQGLSLPALLHAFRIDLRIIWEALIEEALSRSPETGATFIGSPVLMWQVVEAIEANTAEVVDAYRRMERDIAQRFDEVQQKAFEQLMREGERNPSALQEASSRLSLPLEGPYLVVSCSEIHDRDSAALTATSRLRSAGLACYLAWSEGELALVIAKGMRSTDEVLVALQDLQDWPTGIAAADGLRSVPRSLRLARRVVLGMAEPGLRTLESSWIPTLVGVDRELADALGNAILGPLLKLPELERSAILETIEAFLDGGGSVADVAAKLYRHRNTVRHRLQSAERLCGLDFSRPADLATMTLAIEWLRGPSGQVVRWSPVRITTRPPHPEVPAVHAHTPPAR